MGEAMMQRVIHYVKREPVNDPELWYAIYTMFKSEKQVCDHLIRKGVQAYMPLITRTRKYGRKIKQYKVPLINCYLFVKIKKSETVKVLETEHVLKFIKQGKDLIPIPQEEIDVLKRLEGFDGDIVAEPSEYEIGEQVQISKGSLAGLKGKLINKQSNKIFVIEINSIGVTLQMNIDVNLLAKISAKKAEILV